jgi:hypothetical protein
MCMFIKKYEVHGEISSFALSSFKNVRPTSVGPTKPQIPINQSYSATSAGRRVGQQTAGPSGRRRQRG